MGTMEAAGDIPFKAIRPGGLWVPPLPPHHCSHCPPRPRRQQVDVWTATLGLHAPRHQRGFKAAAGEMLAKALVARKPDIACHPGLSLCEHLHTTIHLGEKKTLTLLQTACLRFPRQNATVPEIIQACKACQLMKTGKRQHTGMRY